MKRRQVVLSPEANRDLVATYDRIANAASTEVAFSYLERLETFLNGFDLASERGTLREDVRPGLRIVGFERRMTIAFQGSRSVSLYFVCFRPDVVGKMISKMASGCSVARICEHLLNMSVGCKPL